MNSTPDLVMTFAVLAMFTEGKTKITNVENLKIKETDRLEALKNEISKFGIKVKTGKSYIEIIGNPKLPVDKKIVIETYDDHRMAMCFGILEDISPKLKIKNKKCVSKSYTSYWEDLKKLKMLKNPIIKIALFHSTAKSLTMATTFFLAIHLNNIGISGFQIGTLFAVATLTSILTIIPSGFINDKINSKTSSPYH